MRYFTPELYNRSEFQDSDAESDWTQGLSGLEGAMVAYLDHRTRLAPQLQSVDHISHPFFVNDGLLVRLESNIDAEYLALTFRIGNLIVGYSDLTLTYSGASVPSQDFETLTKILDTTKSDQKFEHKLYCHEFDVLPNGMIEHSMLFSWDALTVSIACTAVTPTIAPRPDRDFRR
jgi:hypothetical protein